MGTGGREMSFRRFVLCIVDGPVSTDGGRSAPWRDVSLTDGPAIALDVA